MRMNIKMILLILLFAPLGYLFADTLVPAPDASQQVIVDAVAQFTSLLLSMLGSSAWSVKITGVILSAVGLAGGASVIVKLFEKVAAITPNTKDDEYAHWLARGFGWVVWVLSAVAMNPKVQAVGKTS